MHRLFREGLFEESIDISSRNTFHVSPGVLSLERGNFFTSQYAIPLPFHFCSHFFPSFLFLFSAGNFGKTWTITVTSSPPTAFAVSSHSYSKRGRRKSGTDEFHARRRTTLYSFFFHHSFFTLNLCSPVEVPYVYSTEVLPFS